MSSQGWSKPGTPKATKSPTSVTIGTVAGSVTGQAISMWIEKKLRIGV